MNTLPSSTSTPPISPENRLDYLDATRAFALILGVVFHAGLAYLPVYVGWAVQDVSTSMVIGAFSTVSHAFRLELFFLLAGFFGHLTLRRRGAAALLKSRVTRIIIPFVVGWFLLRPLIISGWIMGFASMRGDYAFWSAILAGFEEWKKLPTGLLVGTHLWFLYYLALISGIALGLRALLQIGHANQSRGAAEMDAVVAWWAHSRWTLPIALVAIIPTLGFMDNWGVDTPDKSLWPHLPTLVLYGGWFGLGWLLDRQQDLLPTLAKLSWTRGLLAILSVAATLWLTRFQMDPGHPHHDLARHVYNVSYAVMMWTLVWLTIGVFRHLFDRSSAAVRYVADSSYWMYLIHLPIVVWLQVATAEVELPWLLKLTGISIATIGICLLTYDLFVRSTIIGATLNGRRRPRVLFSRKSN